MANELPVKGLNLNGVILTTNDKGELIYDGKVIRLATYYAFGEAGEDIDQFKVCIFDSGKVYLADHDTDEHTYKPKFISMIAQSSGGEIKLQNDLRIKDEALGLTTDSVYYVGSDGELTDTAPDSGFLQRIGTALSETELQIHQSESVKL